MSEDAEHDTPDLNDLGRLGLTADSHAQMEAFRSSHETSVLTILLSDLEGSTRQQTDLGNVRAADLVKAHRRVFRNVLEAFDGQEVETAGDSFLVVFAAPSEGVKFTLHMQAAMQEARGGQPDLPAVRVGIHQGQVIVERHADGPKPMDIYGLQVAAAARIMDLARGGQILCSRAVFDDARAILRGTDLADLGPVAWRNHGPYRFKGFDDTYDVCEVGEQDAAPLEAPAAAAKGWPADVAEEELGWRPAVGVAVPETNWVLEERLGKEGAERPGPVRFKGEFGEVWKAFNASDKSHQVFKFCFKRDRVPVFKREARLLKRLRTHRHPNLVEVYDVTEGDRPPYYLEMEYVEGPTLEAWLGTDPPLSDRLEIIAQVADALDTVHAAGIYHRDIKPSNILLTHRGDGALQAKLTDFGLGAAEDRDLLKSIYESRVEGVAGTWDYIAPELRKGEPASAQSDLYSLGVTLYQMAVGDLDRPLTGDWETLVESDILLEDIRRCIATDPARRWPGAADLAKALRSHDQRVHERQLEREREEQRRRARRARTVAAAVAVLALAAAVALIVWWRLPGTLDLEVTPPGTRIEIGGRTLTAGEDPIPLRLRAGSHEARFFAPDHDSQTLDIVVKRLQARTAVVTLRHHQGLLEAECEPLGSEIEVDGVAYGSRIRNLSLNTGRHRLLAWSNDHFDSERTVRLRHGETTRERFWLDRGMRWTYTSPAVQGSAFLVGDADGDGVPEIAHNELDHVVILSGATGEVVARLPAAGSGSRAFDAMEFGGAVGRVLVAAKEVPGTLGRTGGLDVFAIRVDAPIKFLWRWTGPKREWTRPAGAPNRAVPDLTDDGVAELAVASRDGRIYILNGATGELDREITAFEKPLAQSFGIHVLGGEGAARLIYLMRSGDPLADAGGTPRTWTAGCLAVTDGAHVWRKDLGQIDSVMVRDLDGDGVRELFLWDDGGWQVLIGASGTPRRSGRIPKGLRMPPYPILLDLDDDGTPECMAVSVEAPQSLAAVRVKDGAVLWRSPEGVLKHQPLTRAGTLHRTPRGGVLMAFDRSLAALDPETGSVRWRVEGTPEGVLVGDWDGDGTDEIFVTIQGRGLVCLGAEGNERWTLRLDVDVRPYALVPDADGDGLPEILIHRHAGLFGLVRGPRVLWTQEATAPLQATPRVVENTSLGRPLVMQVGPWGGRQHLRCLDGPSGAVLWSTACWFPPNRTAAVADWDGDGRPDVINIGRPPEAEAGHLVAFRAVDGAPAGAITLKDCGVLYSAPVVADFNGDETPDLAVHRWDRQDIIVVDGKRKGLMWRHATKGPNMGGVGAADLDGDGLPDVVAPSMDGHVYALRGTDGRPLWPPADIGRGGSRAPPLLEDVNDDQVPDVLVVAQSGVMYVIDGKTGRTIWEGRASGATEGLGRPAAARIEDRKVILAPLGYAGVVAFDVAKRAEVWRASIRPVVAGPVVADLDADGLSEVVVGSTDGYLLVFDLADGRPLWRVRVSTKLIEADPAVVDVNGDGVLDILVADHDFKLTAVSGLGTRGARRRWRASSGSGDR